MPCIEQHAFVGSKRIAFVEVDKQHLFTFKDALRERAGFVDFALFVRRMMLIKVVGGVDIQLIFAMAAQHDADRVDIEIVVDLFCDFAYQLINIQTRQDGVGDCNQNTEVIAFAAQQIIIDIIVYPVLNLLGDHADNLGKRMQTVIFLFTPGTIFLTDEFAAAENTALRG